MRKLKSVAYFKNAMKTLFTCDLPVRPSFRLSDGHEGQEVVS